MRQCAGRVRSGKIRLDSVQATRIAEMACRSHRTRAPAGVASGFTQTWVLELPVVDAGGARVACLKAPLRLDADEMGEERGGGLVSVLVATDGVGGKGDGQSHRRQREPSARCLKK